jgi:hypothetical protein
VAAVGDALWLTLDSPRIGSVGTKVGRAPNEATASVGVALGVGSSVSVKVGVWLGGEGVAVDDGVWVGVAVLLGVGVAVSAAVAVAEGGDNVGDGESVEVGTTCSGCGARTHAAIIRISAR